MHILSDSMLESLEHDRHAKVYIVNPKCADHCRLQLSRSDTPTGPVFTSEFVCRALPLEAMGCDAEPDSEWCHAFRML